MMGQSWWAWVIRVGLLVFWAYQHSKVERNLWERTGCLVIALLQLGVIVLYRIELGA